jgi:hypothetical protein
VTVAARWSGSAAHTALGHETTCLYAFGEKTMTTLVRRREESSLLL